MIEFSPLIGDSGTFLCFLVMKRGFLMNETNAKYGETIEVPNIIVS